MEKTPNSSASTLKLVNGPAARDKILVETLCSNVGSYCRYRRDPIDSRLGRLSFPRFASGGHLL
jgi:hypothetical protein